MKNYNIKLIIVSLTFFFAFKSLKAQNDYVITLKNDTLKGVISDQIFGGHRFKSNESTKAVKINVKEYKEFYIASDQRNYCAVLLPNGFNPLFINRVEKGRIELYELITTTYGAYGMNSSVTSWYVSKDKSPLVMLKHNSWLTFSRDKRKNEFHELIMDNESVVKQYEAEEKFSFKSIKALVQQYNFDAVKKDLENEK